MLIHSAGAVRHIDHKSELELHPKVIDAKTASDDIRSGMDHAALMRKYNLSLKGLTQLYEKLLWAEVISKSEIDGKMPSPGVPLNIRNQFTDDVIFSCAAATVKELVENAVREKMDLAEADLSYANLAGVNAQGALLAEANLLNANLNGADLTDAVLFRAELSQSVLSRALLVNADLSEANLTGSYMVGCNLSGAVLIQANMDGADLRGAVLKFADLREARFLNAKMSGTDLTEANLEGAILDADSK